MTGFVKQMIFCFAWLCLTAVTYAGPYNEAGVNGFVDSNSQPADPCSQDAVLNPIFRAWATGVQSYLPAPQPIQAWWMDSTKALGAVTGDKYDIVTLGDLEESQILQLVPPGEVTLTFNTSIQDVNGYDFVVYENAFIIDPCAGDEFALGELFAELGYVEVSSNGSDFIRFPAISVTPEFVGVDGTVNASDLFNLAGKHLNNLGKCTGTPFDLRELAYHQMVTNGTVDINNITYVRIVDIPGSGYFQDNAQQHIDPDTWPNWDYYQNNNPIYDSWVTYASGGFDLEAIGVLNDQQYSADINLDGIVDGRDLRLLCSAWLSHFGEENWIQRCDVSEPADLVIDFLDFAVFAEQWNEIEQWHLN